MRWIFFGFLMFAVALGAVGGWYVWTVRSYEKWFDEHLMGTVFTDSKRTELEGILNQPFRYLNQGSTSKAYVSQDGRFVIKFFLRDQYISKKFRNIPWISKLANRKRTVKMKYDRSFGPIYAQQYIPNESGMIYYQFIKPRDLFHRSVHLIEKDGSESEVDLDRAEFVIQKKAVLVSEYLLDHIARGDLETAKSGISKLLRMTKLLYDQGIVLSVLQFLDNFGFVNDEPIRIDVEHVRFEPNWKEMGKNHLRKQIPRFRAWLKKHAPPEVVEHFDAEIRDLELEG